MNKQNKTFGIAHHAQVARIVRIGVTTAALAATIGATAGPAAASPVPPEPRGAVRIGLTSPVPPEPRGVTVGGVSTASPVPPEPR